MILKLIMIIILNSHVIYDVDDYYILGFFVHLSDVLIMVHFNKHITL